MQERALDGELAPAFIQGEAGIGKSRLLDATLEEAQKKGFRIFRGRCEELELARSFGALADAFGCKRDAQEIQRREIATVLLEPTTSRTIGNVHFRVAEVFGTLVESEAVNGPIAIALDDVHWADASTIYTLHSLITRIADLPVFVVATLRLLPRRTELERLISRASENGATVLQLEPLDFEAVAQLAERVAGKPPSERMQGILSAAGGNPLFVEELVHALDKEKAISISQGVADVTRVFLPPDLRITLLRRISYLSDHALDLLRIASVLGTRFLPGDLQITTGQPMNNLMHLIEEWSRAGLVVEDGSNLRFRHDLIQDVLYEDMAEGIRTALHLQIARALAKSGAPSDRVAQHFLRGASPGDSEATRALRDAAAESSLSPRTRVELLRQASDLMTAHSVERDATEVELADALIWAGAPEEALALARQVLRRKPDSDSVNGARLVLARALWLMARWQDLAELTREFLTDSELTESEQAELLAHKALADVFTTNVPEAAVIEAEKALALGEQLGNEYITVQALLAVSLTLNFAGRSPEEIPIIERAVQIVEGSSDPAVHRLHPHVALGLAYHVFGRFEEAEKAFRQGVRLREQSGTIWDVPYHLAITAMVHERWGKWDDAVAEAKASIASGAEIGTQVGLILAHLILGNISLQRGDPNTAGRHLVIAQELVQTLGPQWGTPKGLAFRLFEARGETAKALALVRDPMGAQERALMLLEHVPLALHAGEHELARQLVAECERVQVGGNPALEAFTLAGRGLVDDTPELLLEAADVFRTLGLWHRFLVAEHAGASLGRKGRLDEARPLFLEAIAGYEGLAASRLNARTLSTMRSFGISIGKRGTRRRPTFGWESLTETELRVAELAAEGFTNPQIAEQLFISRHTVVSHMKHVFSKLGINSRIKLAAQVSRFASGNDEASSNQPANGLTAS